METRIKTSLIPALDSPELNDAMDLEAKKINHLLDLAHKYYSLAADKGDAEAMWIKACMHFSFSNTPDLQRYAILLMEKAARKGHL